MISIRKVAFACGAAALVMLPLNAAAQTGPRNQDTYFTFSQSVELPNKTLPAGKYFFQLVDSDSNRHIVKVMSEDRKELHATLMAIPYYTNDRPSDEPQVRFMETPAGTDGTNGTNGTQATNAIKIWFYPGNSVGHEFIYPRSQAMRLAARTSTPVLTTKTETEAVADAELTRVDAAGADATVDTSNRSTAETTTAAQVPAPTTPEPMPEPARTEPAPQPMPEPARTEPAPQPMPERTTRATRTELPNTAGFLPLLALIGIGSLVGSRLLRRSSRRA